MKGLRSGLMPPKHAQRCHTGPSGGFIAHLIALVSALVFNASNANAANCFPNHLAPMAMQEVRELVEAESLERRNVHWYSTSNQEQTNAAYQLLAGLNDPDSVPKGIRQLHFINVGNQGFLLFITDDDRTCGFAEPVAIKPELGRRAISAANAVLERQTDQLNRQYKDRFPARSRLMDLRNILMYQELLDQMPESLCQTLHEDPELGIVPEIEELDLNGTFRGTPVDYIRNFPRQYRDERAENFLKNAVGTDNVVAFWRISHIVLVPNGNHTDVLMGTDEQICGFGSFASFPTVFVNSWFEPYQDAHRSTQPGDPLFNMTDEERRAFQMMQGIINGNDPVGDLQGLFNQD